MHEHSFEINGPEGKVLYRSRFTGSAMEGFVRDNARKSGKSLGTNPNALVVGKAELDPSACSGNPY